MARKPQTAPEQEKEDKVTNNTSEPEKEQEQVKEASTEADTPEQEKEDKVYTFKSKNPFLSCVSLGVQFVDGKATTDDLSVARALATIDGVDLVEE